MSAGSADALMEAAIEAGADDCVTDENGHLISTTFENLSEVSKALEAKLGAPASAKMVWKPGTMTALDEEKAQSMMKLLDAFDNDDDVQNVYSNFEVSDEVMSRLTG